MHDSPMPTYWAATVFDPTCVLCPRLAQFHKDNRKRYPTHYNAAVPPFGRADAGLLVVGLAPGLHGANRTGRPFTGDFCGELLYATLHQFGFASKAISEHAKDDLLLNQARVTNAVKCVPPQNKPIGTEINTCNQWLKHELIQHPPQIILALGVVAHQAVLKAYGLTQSAWPFAHGAVHYLPQVLLLDSYHVSRYNTQTKRLTPEMFAAVVANAKLLLAQSHATMLTNKHRKAMT